MPRKEGMERKDLLAANVKIFKVTISDSDPLGSGSQFNVNASEMNYFKNKSDYSKPWCAPNYLL